MRKKSNPTTILCFIIGLLILLIILNHNENNYLINIYESPENNEYNETIKEPKRYYDSKYYNRGRMRINVPTRGEPPPYQQVGILTDTLDPSAPSTPNPPTAKFPWAIAYNSPSAPFKGVIKSVPPLSDLAFPIAETVTSNACPGLENAGKSAVTITAAAFFAVKSLVLTTISNCDIKD